MISIRRLISKSFSPSINPLETRELFTLALADGVSLESEGQQVSSGSQNSAQYSKRFYLNFDINTSSPFSEPMETVPREPIIIDINDTPMLHRCFFLQFSGQIQVLISFFAFFYFHSGQQSRLYSSFFFLLLLFETSTNKRL